VIRIDPIEGGIDYGRWPVTADGESLYWAGLNKGKKSVAINLCKPEGQELAQSIITAPGDARGLFVSNFPAMGWLDYDALRGKRADLIMLSIVGNHDGSTALDYTVNCAVGFPGVTGPAEDVTPVNHVLPAWDLICGQTGATALLAAERHRRLTGAGQRIRIALSDIALAVVGDLGFVAEVEINGTDRARCGNHIYGAFGHDFETKDGRRVMIAAVSASQWAALCKATGISPAVASFEGEKGADLKQDGDRFAARDQIARWLEPWFKARSLAEIRTQLDANRACWGVYQSFAQLVSEDPRCSPANPLFERAAHPAIGTSLTPRSPIDYSGCEPVAALLGPRLGQHTDEVLHEVLGLNGGAIGRLHDQGIVSGKGA
jgi:2-methylfumaryl-CoA isomerase